MNRPSIFLGDKRFRFFLDFSVLRSALYHLSNNRVFNSREGGWCSSLYFSISIWSLAFRFEIKSSTMLRTRKTCIFNYFSILSVPLRQQYIIAVIFALYIKRRRLSCSVLKLRLLLLRCLLMELFMASCQITRSFRFDEK